MPPTRKLNDHQVDLIKRLSDAGVPRNSIGSYFGLSESGVQLYLGREGHTSPRDQVERLSNAWTAVTDPRRASPDDLSEFVARTVVREVFGPIVRKTLEDTNLESYTRAITASGSPDGFAYRVLGRPTLQFAPNVAAYCIEQARGDDDTPRTLARKAAGEAYRLVPTGGLVLTLDQIEALDHAIDDRLTDRESVIVRALHGGYQDAEPSMAPELARNFGIPEARVAEINRVAARKLRHVLIRDPDFAGTVALPFDTYGPDHLKR
jgi:hypothetical protein